MIPEPVDSKAVGRGQLEIRVVGYDHSDAQALIAEVQQEYVRRYGGPDETPVDPRQFQAPSGHFAVAYVDSTPVAMGGWRQDGPMAAEIKRMYVVPAARGRGYARAMLAYLESSVLDAGLDSIVLETGTRQPEAIGLYHAAGYVAVDAFGHYAGADGAVHLGKQLR